MEAINERPIRDWRLMSSVRWWVMNVFISRWTLLSQVWFVSSIRARSPDTSVLGLDLGVSKRRNVQRKYIVHFPLFIFFGIPLRNAYSRKITILYIRKHFGNKSFKLEPSVIDWEDFFSETARMWNPCLFTDLDCHHYLSDVCTFIGVIKM